MNSLFTYMRENLDYTDYDIVLLKYRLTALFYDLSKLILMAVFFGFIGYLSEYFFSVIILLSLRTSIGGLHFKTYWGCFLFTFIFFIIGVVFLPKLYPDKIIIIISLFICMIITNLIGPIVSCYRKMPDGIAIRKTKIKTSTIIFFYSLIIYIIPKNHYIPIGFWIIIMQTSQLLFAFLQKKTRRCHNEKQSS